MIDLVEVAENKQLHDRIFPIVLSDADIYDPVKRIAYIKHWEAKRAELAEAIKALDPANLQGIRDEIDMYDRIRDKVSGLTSILKDMNTLTPEMHRDSNFSALYDALEKRVKENSIADEKESNESKPASGVKAANNNTSVGSINIGGNVSGGNIIIGNNNNVSSSRSLAGDSTTDAPPPSKKK